MAAFPEIPMPDDDFVEKGYKYDFYFDPAIIQKPTPVHVKPQPGRNDPCSCGSGKKYKKCCYGK